MKEIKKSIFSFVLALAMVLTLMPMNSTTVYAADSHTIAITSVANGSVTATSTSVEAGTAVTLTANPDSGYHLDSLSGTFSGSESLSNSGATVEGTYSTLTSTNRASAGWSMKSQTDTITVSAKGEGGKISKIEFNQNNKGTDWVPGKLGTDCEATISSSGSTVSVVLAEPQQTVTLSTTAINSRTGCTLNSAKVYGEFILNIDTSTLTFTMPDSDITITPSFVHVHTNHYGVATTNTTNDTLTWYCGEEGCDSTATSADPVKLTLSASDATYSGNAVTAGFDSDEAAEWEAAGLTALPIVYEAKTDSSLTDDKAVNVGSYTASITEGTATASVDFEIKQPEIDAAKSDVNSTGLIKESYIVGTATKDLDVDINFDIAKIDATDDYASSVIVKEGTKTLTYGDHYTVSEGSIKVTLTKSYLNGLPVGTHDITIEITDNNSQKLTYPITIAVASVPSSGGGSTAPTTTPTYKVPNTSVGQDINPMNKTIGLLAIAAVAGYVVKKKED